MFCCVKNVWVGVKFCPNHKNHCLELPVVLSAINKHRTLQCPWSKALLIESVLGINQCKSIKIGIAVIETAVGLAWQLPMV